VRRVLRLAALTIATGAAAVAGYLAFTLPPRAAVTSARRPATTVYGAYHVHSVRSDGSGTIEEIAADAASAGLAFVVFTDHGDGTRPPDPPAYRRGVLCIDAVEIGTVAGHVVALNIREPSEYPLGGEARDVLEDIRRLGGWAVAAHPDSPRPELRWRATLDDVDAIEWLNVDSEWRDEPVGRLIAMAGRTLFRPAESIAALFSRPVRTLSRWDSAGLTRPVVGLAAADAHARVDWRDDAEPRGARGWAFPSYEAVFRAVSLAVNLEAPLSGDAGEDARRLLNAIMAGRTYGVVRAFADPAVLNFAAESADGAQVGMGATVHDPAGISLRGAVQGLPGASLVLIRNGKRVATGQGSLEVPAEGGVYRLEAFAPGFSFPWMVSNPIRIGLPEPVQEAPSPPPPPVRALRLGADAGWRIEQDASSTATITGEGDGLRVEFRLGPGRPAGQYAALVTSASGDATLERVRFAGRADRPMRLSVQIRVPGGPDGRRWRRSVYLDSTPRTIDLRLADFDPVGPATALRPIVARVQSVLFVVDTVNTQPGAAGTVWISGVTFGLGEAGGGD
jgi:hypothetical protein